MPHLRNIPRSLGGLMNSSESGTMDHKGTKTERDINRFIGEAPRNKAPLLKVYPKGSLPASAIKTRLSKKIYSA